MSLHVTRAGRVAGLAVGLGTLAIAVLWAGAAEAHVLLADPKPPAAYRSRWRKQALLENIAPDGAGELRIERWVRSG